jgi:hypothetical protein
MEADKKPASRTVTEVSKKTKEEEFKELWLECNLLLAVLKVTHVRGHQDPEE